jgi:aminopeptidase N/puromycin-sensitive aminopeptidase
MCFIAPAFAQRLSTAVVPSHYTLALAPDLQSATFTGEETIDVAVKEPTRAITLNAIELAFQSVTIDAGGQKQTAAVTLDENKQQATFTFPGEIPAGPAALKIHFTGILNNKLRGFYLSKTDKRNYAVTQFEATDARRAFPSFDEPAFKATFDVALTIDAADTAISNSPIVSDTPGPVAGKHTLRFDTTPKMSTYLLAFLVGDFECTAGEQDGVALRVCSTPGKDALRPYALDVAKYVLHYYDDYFGIHFPLKKLDLIGIPDFEAGAMENFGAITYRETDLLLDPKTASIAARENVAVVVAHEMAHQWFGDLVTMQWWDNIWLNEGFASWMENKPVAAMHPEWNIPEEVAAGQQQTLNLDAQPTTRAIRAKADTPEEIDQMFDGISYGKASDVLLMVENYLGEESFRKGVHNYLAAHLYGNATAEDFWSTLAATSSKPVDKIMESLVAQPGVPILNFGAPENGQFPVAQSRFFLSPSSKADPSQKWTLPVCFATASGQSCQVLSPSSAALPLPGSAPVFANASGKGYYRAAYAPAQYAALVAQAETALTPAERIALLGDEWAQVRANKATVGDYLNLVAALKDDSDVHVLSAALGNAGSIAERVASNQQERDALAAWASRNFAPAYARLGAPAASDTPNTRELRALLFSLLAGRGNDPALREQARAIAAQYLDDPASTDVTLGQTALAIAASHGDAALFDRLQKTYETSADPELQHQALRLLAGFHDPALLNRALEYSLTAKVRNQDAALQFAVAMSVAENRETAWKFIQAHWGQIQSRLPIEMGEILVGSTGGFCTAEAREEVKSFFAAHPVPTATVQLHHAIESIDGCIELRRLQEPNLKSWLATQPAN